MNLEFNIAVRAKLSKHSEEQFNSQDLPPN